MLRNWVMLISPRGEGTGKATGWARPSRPNTYGRTRARRPYRVTTSTRCAHITEKYSFMTARWPDTDEAHEQFLRSGDLTMGHHVECSSCTLKWCTAGMGWAGSTGASGRPAPHFPEQTARCDDPAQEEHRRRHEDDRPAGRKIDRPRQVQAHQGAQPTDDWRQDHHPP